MVDLIVTEMFIRTVKAWGGKGAKYEYLRLVESHWENGSCHQRVVLNLGRKDMLAPHLDSLVRILEGEGEERWVKVRDVCPGEGACWGPVLVAEKLWRELSLDIILDSCGGNGSRPHSTPLADRVLVLVIQRLCGPGSEHGLAGWLDTHYICDRYGRRWLPPWEEHGRVKVNRSWLQRWYRTLDELLKHKERIEQSLYLRLRDLFSLQAEMVFYDLTSTYFEGAGPKGWAEHGYSRDDKPRQRQLLVGVVMVNGWPIAHHVFPSKRTDAATVRTVVEDIERRFGLKRVVFVGDRGMVTTDNLNWVRRRGHGYLVGLQRRRREQAYRYVKKATGPWLECPAGIGDRETKEPHRTWVQEVEGDEAGVRVFVVHSEERLAYERGMREAAMRPTQLALQKLAKRVAKGKVKQPEKIGAAATRILSRHHGKRYFIWRLEGGAFQYFEHPDLEKEKALEGKYLIQTEEKGLTPIEAVNTYKQLSEVEQAFRNLKDIIGMRPIFHRNGYRARGHIFLAVLALLLRQALDKKLRAAGTKLSPEAALEALHNVQVIDMEVGSGHKHGVTTGRQRSRQVLAALGITHLQPPPEPN